MSSKQPPAGPANIPFENLPMPRKDIPASPVGRYRLYKDADNFTLIDAASALEALQLSGMQTAYRIERDTIFLSNVLDLAALTKAITESADKQPDVAAEAAAPAPEAAAPTEAAPAQAPAAEPPPLTGDDVNKLLQNN